jgi:hypothetical protein
MTVAKNHTRPQPLLIDVSNTDIHLSLAQFKRLQSDNPDLRLELTTEGKLIVRDLPAASFEEEVSSQSKITPSSVVSGNAKELTSPQDLESVSEFTQDPQSSKVLNFSEMTVQERIEAIENHKKNRQAIIDSLTPEELELSNQQFEHMFKQLDESRNYNY